jgi:hypothetical protein
MTLVPHFAVLAFSLALLAAAPAAATGGMACRTAGANPIEVGLVVGHAVVPAIVGARLTDRGRAVPVAVAQAWLDEEMLRLDLVDPQAMRRELRLTARRSGAHYDGSLWRDGKRRGVRCREA